MKSSLERFGEKTAVISGDERFTYADLRDLSTSIARGLMAMGLEKGDHVALWMPNNEYFIPCFLGITAAGCVMVPMNTRYRAVEAGYILRNSDSRVLITVERFANVDYMALLGGMEASLGGLEKVIVLGDGPCIVDTESITLKRLIEIGARVGDERLKKTLENIEPGDAAMILYTSGTTGAPKGAMLTHSNVCRNAITTGEVMGVRPKDRYFVPLPLFHVFGLVLGCLTPLAFGASVVLEALFDPERAIETMERHRCTMNFGVPAMFIMELEEIRKGERDLSSLRSGIMGGAPCPIEVVRATMEEMGCNVCIGYGITETSPLITLTRFDDTPERRANTVGRPIPGVEVRIVNDARDEVPRGERGEIAIRANNMAGYYRMTERTAEVLDDDGWYYSGDLGTMDGDDYVSVTGRKKDLIITGGFNVYPREVEELLFTHPSVRNAAVVGAPDGRLGEVVYAYIILKEGKGRDEVDEDGIREFCRSRLANFKVPRYVEFVSEFPMTQSGKVQKFRLREMAAGKDLKENI